MAASSQIPHPTLLRVTHLAAKRRSVSPTAIGRTPPLGLATPANCEVVNGMHSEEKLLASQLGKKTFKQNKCFIARKKACFCTILQHFGGFSFLLLLLLLQKFAYFGLLLQHFAVNFAKYHPKTKTAKIAQKWSKNGHKKASKWGARRLVSTYPLHLSWCCALGG